MKEWVIMKKIVLGFTVIAIFLLSSLTFAQSVTHTVKTGETLQSIAATYQTTWDAIAKQNGITNPNSIMAGQVLVIPSQPSQTTPRASSPGTHIVVYGDTLSTIADRYNVSVDAIASANGITRATVLYAGDILTIPAGSAGIPPTSITPVTPVQPIYPMVTPNWHYILPGQTMLQISMMYGVSPWAIAQANGIYNLNLIYSGTWLYIP